MKRWLLWVLASAVAFGVGGHLGVALSPSGDLIVVGYVAVTASLSLAGNPPAPEGAESCAGTSNSHPDTARRSRTAHRARATCFKPIYFSSL